MPSTRVHRALLSAALLSACYSSHEVGSGIVLGNATDGTGKSAGASVDAGVGHSDLQIPPGCIEDPNNPPQTLECTGLYSSLSALVAKEVPPNVRPFTPATPLWSDGADKQRWIHLPAGATIDTSRPADWSFPVGTKAWKEFKHNGQRIETRLWHKVRSDRWLAATYIWKNNETAAEFSFGADVPVSDGVYHVPTPEECDKCHKGRADRLLGFEAALLGLPGAQGVTLAGLASEARLSPPPAQTQFQIPDDGTGLAAQALSWLHVNCGVSCHNEDPNSTGYITGMFLRIDPAKLSSGSVAGWNVLTTTLNVSANTPAFLGSLRIVPGAPDQSLIVRLASTRGTNQQMPPIASKIVDVANVDIVKEWIRRLAPDAGPPDSGVSGASPVLAEDASVPDSGVASEAQDAGLPSSEPVDASPIPAPAADPPLQVQ